MSRAAEAFRHLNGLTSQDSCHELTTAEPTPLWRRFQKVHDAIKIAFTTDNRLKTIQREINSHHWRGHDEGAHDHSGHVSGSVGNIALNLDFKGTTHDNATKVDENWRLVRYTEKYGEISGTFTSLQDNRKGFVRVVSQGDQQTEAYWLEIADGRLRLEQVLTASGSAYETEQIDSINDEVPIPGTNFRFPRYLSPPDC